MSDQATPMATTPHTPRNKRLSLRVDSSQLPWWQSIARLTEQSFSGMIRTAIEEYITAAEQAPPSNGRAGPYGRLAELFSVFGGSSTVKLKKRRGAGGTCDKTVVLRVSVTELKRWTEAADREFSTVSFMIRVAVTRYVQSYVDAISLRAKEKEENKGNHPPSPS